MTETQETISAQEGPQEAFLASSADIVFYGGSAGGGKTVGLLLEPLRHIHRPHFGAVIFRRTTPEIRNEGGLWDESLKIYPLVGAVGSSHRLRWTFPSGASVTFAHMEHEDDRMNWHGSQIPMIGFDEICSFTEKQFTYMLSRNRSTMGIRPYIRATCNPDADSFVAKFIQWWIDPDTGYAIPERSGVVRWFGRVNDEIVWGESREELKEKYGEEIEPKSFTFIRSTLRDNQILMRKDPSYEGNLKALSKVDRERLLLGNWKIRPTAGLIFRREWFEIVAASPKNGLVCRYWDRAGTEGSGDWTVGLKMRKASSGLHYVEDVVRFQGSPLKVEEAILNTASQDKKDGCVTVYLEQDPGQAGKADVGNLIRRLAGYVAKAVPVTGDKLTRAKPVSAQCEAGNVKLVEGRWNEPLLNECENFTGDDSHEHDDIVDTLSGAFNKLNETGKVFFAC
jgi:predicted phage terminase large subunit-like protein